MDLKMIPLQKQMQVKFVIDNDVHQIPVKSFNGARLLAMCQAAFVMEPQ